VPGPVEEDGQQCRVRLMAEDSDLVQVMAGSPHLDTNPPFWTGHPASTPQSRSPGPAYTGTSASVSVRHPGLGQGQSVSITHAPLGVESSLPLGSSSLASESASPSANVYGAAQRITTVLARTNGAVVRPRYTYLRAGTGRRSPSP
jgi:hypothetical protein